MEGGPGVDRALSPREAARAPVGIVLAGGRATRLGAVATREGGKAALTLDGRTLLAAVVAALEPHVGRIVVVAAHRGMAVRPPAGFDAVAVGSRPDVETIHDTVADGGPLSALADALRHVAGARDAGGADEAARATWLRAIEAIVVSCDVPLVRPEVVGLLLERLRLSGARWVVPEVHGHPQVLVSAVRGDLLPAIERHLATGRRDLKGLLGTVAHADPTAVLRLDPAAVALVDPDLDSFRDIDTPDDLAALRARIGSRSSEQ
jgi:molybdopterin-guanine dinucleotide biosynthesis protein A